MITVEEILDPAALPGLRLPWKSLLAETREPGFFHTLDWLQAYWQGSGSEGRLRILVIKRNGKAIGILPWVIVPEPTPLGRLRVLTSPLPAWGDYCGPIGPSPTVTLLKGLRHLTRTRCDYDLFDLRGVDLYGVDSGRTRQAMRQVELPFDERPWKQLRSVVLGTPKRNSPTQNSFHPTPLCNTSHPSWAKHGDLQFFRYRPAGAAFGDDDPRFDLLEACQTIAQDASPFGEDVSRERFEAIHATAVHAGGLDLNLLLLDQAPIAFSYNVHYAGRVSVAFRGERAEYTECAPAEALQAWMLGDGAQRGDRRYDFPGTETTNEDGSFGELVTSYHYLHRPRWRARTQLLRLPAWLKHRFRRRAVPSVSNR